MPRGPSPEETERRLAAFRAALAGVVGEDVVAFGYFTAPGYASGSMDDGSGFGAVVKKIFSRSKMPLQLYLALTPTRIAAVRFTRHGADIAPTEVVRTWDRGSTTVDMVERGGNTAFTLHAAGEERPTKLESVYAAAAVNEAFLAAFR